MKIRKKNRERATDRKIPEADLGDFETPDIAKVRVLQNSDVELVMSLTNELRVTGVIDRNGVEIRDRQTLQELGAIFSEAELHQKYEKDINPEFYDEATDAILEDRQVTEGDLFDNPSLDGIDDYGSQVYDRYIESDGDEVTHNSGETNFPKVKDFEENSSKSAAIRLPDGTIIYGELL